MPAETYMLVERTGGEPFTVTAILGFSFRKDAYTPYTSLSVRASANGEAFLEASGVKFFVNGHLVHYGLIDKLSTETAGGCRTVTLLSRGFTSLLCQNQIEPGLRMGVSINSLMDSVYSFPNVTHENNSDTSSYIFVKNNSSIWDGIVNLSYKHCGTYPYIRGTNCVRMTDVSAPETFTYTEPQLLSLGEAMQGLRLVSHFHMADISGEFGSYELCDEDVCALGIVRHKFFELDKQFLHEPQNALTYRDKYSTRACKQRFCTYRGYNGEDLSDIVTFGEVSSRRISAVEITGKNCSVTTKISVYDDKFTRS